MHDFTYLEAASVEEAVALSAKYGADSAMLAGGTNLLYLMKRGVRLPKYLINIKGVNGLDSVRFDKKGGLVIGSLVSLDDLEHSEDVVRNYPMLSTCAGGIASPQIRNMGTVGGNLSQEVWCWYLTEGFNCWMNGGKHCFAPGGDNRYHHSVTSGYICMAIHPSDLAPAFEALDARIHVLGPNYEKEIGIEDLLPGFTMVEGRLKQNTLKTGELITAVKIPAPARGSRGVFLKFSARKSFDFALSSVAMVMTIEDGFCLDSRIVFGAVATKPYRAVGMESALKGKRITEGLLRQASQKVFDKEIPLSMNSYRIQLTKELARKALFEICGLARNETSLAGSLS